jgi:hypothetical protein
MKVVEIKKNAIRVFATLSIFLLFASFGMHAIQIPHGHFDGQNHTQTSEKSSSVFVTLGEYMHVAEKKMLLDITVALLLSATFLYGSFSQFVRKQNLWFVSLLRWREKLILTTLTCIKLLFFRGILNPKLY